MTTAADGRAILRRWAGWGGALLAVALVAILTCLAAANVVVRANWMEVEDGVLWAERPEGVVAAEVSPGSPGHQSGVQPGDVLLAIDGQAVESVNDVVATLHSGREGTRLELTVLHLGTRQLRTVRLEPVPTNGLTIYFVLAGVGLFALLVGMSVRVRRPKDQATLHFFWLTVAFFGMLAFSFSGRLDRLDWVFFWADAVSTLLLAPLFVHFALVFPDRSAGWVRQRFGRSVFPVIYFPALALGVTQVIALSGPGTTDAFTRLVEAVWRLEILYLAVCVLAGLAIMIVSLRGAPSVTSRRQLRWIVWGAVLGGVPFTIGYAVPFALGIDLPGRLYLTAIPLGLIPLAFASAIVRYRLRDVEVIVKRGLVYTAAVAAMVAMYLVLEQLASEVFLEESDGHNSIIALLATAVVVLLASPVKNSIQNMLDRAHYRDRYDYRRALVGFARDLNSDLDLGRLSERLVARVTETLVVDRMVLLLAERRSETEGDLWPIRATGFDVMPPPLKRSSALAVRLAARHMVALDDPAMTRRFPPDEVEAWLQRGICYFIPCVSEEGTIAVMAVGRKGSGEPLSSEDMALLSAVAGQVATALENGRLYSQLREKAGELDRMREFAENIIESLNDGLVVLDLDDRVVRWNAGLERLYGVSRTGAVGQPLDTLFDRPFVDLLRQARADQPAGTASYRVPLLSRHGEGRHRLLVNAATVPLRAADGATTGTMVMMEDITARVQLEEQLQISEKMASIGLLAAGVAHEVNTPLTGISSFTQMLLEGADPDDPRTKLLEKIERQTFRAAKTVNGLLNLARPGPTEASGPIDVNAVISDVLALLEHQLEAGSIKIRRDLSDTSTIVHGVEFKLQQVFLNLFLNARDAMPKGGWLTIRTRTSGRQTVIEVADTGTGIPPELRSRIYDPFFTTKAPGQGTGLGLSVTYGVIQEHQGSIECESAPGHGTRFTITLPLVSLVRERQSEAAL